ncbi:hypothetical protein PR048_030647 [Dryococelus australis]|uniref:Uncharacterized protein n=1 Tax=Dryococelus australis TaxID=614101 RepID=A0ABQ9GDC8_9NEOP|nr:hypothetical protein PR048_030647 [Dryococelus australis]
MIDEHLLITPEAHKLGPSSVTIFDCNKIHGELCHQVAKDYRQSRSCAVLEKYAHRSSVKKTGWGAPPITRSSAQTVDLEEAPVQEITRCGKAELTEPKHWRLGSPARGHRIALLAPGRQSLPRPSLSAARRTTSASVSSRPYTRDISVSMYPTLTSTTTQLSHITLQRTQVQQFMRVISGAACGKQSTNVRVVDFKAGTATSHASVVRLAAAHTALPSKNYDGQLAHVSSGTTCGPLQGRENLSRCRSATVYRNYKELGVGGISLQIPLLQSMSRQSQCSSILQAPSRTVDFTHRFHTFSSIRATNASLAVVPQSAVVHTSLISRTLGQAASVKDCRPLGSGSIYNILGNHPESSSTGVMRHGGLRRQPVSPEHSCVVAKRIGNSSRREEAVTPASLATIGIHGILRRGEGGDTHECIVPGREEGEVDHRLWCGAIESAPAAARINVSSTARSLETEQVAQRSKDREGSACGKELFQHSPEVALERARLIAAYQAAWLPTRDEITAARVTSHEVHVGLSNVIATSLGPARRTHIIHLYVGNDKDMLPQIKPAPRPPKNVGVDKNMENENLVVAMSGTWPWVFRGYFCVLGYFLWDMGIKRKYLTRGILGFYGLDRQMYTRSFAGHHISALAHLRPLPRDESLQRACAVNLIILYVHDPSTKVSPTLVGVYEYDIVSPPLVRTNLRPTPRKIISGSSLDEAITMNKAFSVDPSPAFPTGITTSSQNQARKPRTVGAIKGDAATCIKCPIATKRKVLNWRALFSSHCAYLWDLKRYYWRVVKCCKVSWCLLSAVHSRRTQQEPETRVKPGYTKCTAATHERTARDTLHICGRRAGTGRARVPSTRVPEILQRTVAATLKKKKAEAGGPLFPSAPNDDGEVKGSAKSSAHEQTMAESLCELPQFCWSDYSPPTKGNSNSNPVGVTPGFSHVGIVTDDAAGRRVLSGISRFPHPYIPALLHAHLASPSSYDKGGGEEEEAAVLNFSRERGNRPLPAALRTSTRAETGSLQLQVSGDRWVARHSPTPSSQPTKPQAQLLLLASGVSLATSASSTRRSSIAGGARSSHVRAAKCVEATRDLVAVARGRHRVNHLRGGSTYVDGNTARLARRSDEAIGVRITVARIAPSLLDLERATT